MLNLRTSGFWSFVQEYPLLHIFYKYIIIIYCNNKWLRNVDKYKCNTLSKNIYLS